AGLAGLRYASQLAVAVALPGRLAAVGDHVHHFDRVAAAGQDVAAADADAVGAGPGERHFDAVGVTGEHVVGAATLGRERGLVGGRDAGAADPAALRGVEADRKST